jgi:hypothetical protein
VFCRLLFEHSHFWSLSIFQNTTSDNLLKGLCCPQTFVFVFRVSKQISVVKRFRFNNYFGSQYNQNITVGMYNVKCSGSEKDVRNCKYDIEPHGNCTGLVNVNCGE